MPAQSCGSCHWPAFWAHKCVFAPVRCTCHMEALKAKLGGRKLTPSELSEATGLPEPECARLLAQATFAKAKPKGVRTAKAKAKAAPVPAEEQNAKRPGLESLSHTTFLLRRPEVELVDSEAETPVPPPTVPEAAPFTPLTRAAKRQKTLAVMVARPTLPDSQATQACACFLDLTVTP